MILLRGTVGGTVTVVFATLFTNATYRFTILKNDNAFDFTYSDSSANITAKNKDNGNTISLTVYYKGFPKKYLPHFSIVG